MTECESPPPDRLVIAVRKACEATIRWVDSIESTRSPLGEDHDFAQAPVAAEVALARFPRHELVGSARVDAEIAAAVLEALLRELPEHFGPEAHTAYRFWLRNRIAALRAGKQFQPWVMTTSYLRYPQLLMCEQP